ncbi:unnamed protein product [Hermetia illucens]|uniref:SRP54-type proteins GTP-binding domain-containing protein n=1 Tax=Hermetia illucens TaxID=343691 RepID=A0A7R8UVK5_HERIL|nr:unnamed protein product [Hermetia illucens]
MLDLFTIFTKGGIVLWCFRGTNQLFAPSVNALIRSVILQERGGGSIFEHDKLALQYKLDNEFELVFVVAFQKILQLSYVDKFLSNIHLEFRDKYKNELESASRNFMEYEFSAEFHRILEETERWNRQKMQIPKQMRSFNESLKSKKTVASMIEHKGVDKEAASTKKSVKIMDSKLEVNMAPPSITEEIIMANRKKMIDKLSNNSKKNRDNKKSPVEKTMKKPRVWDLGGSNRDLPNLDRSKDKPEDIQNCFTAENQIIGTMKGGIQDLEIESDNEDYSDNHESESEEISEYEKRHSKTITSKKPSTLFNLFRGLVGSKSLTQDLMAPILDKMRDHLIAKNVATEIAHKLCESVASKLEGKVIGTFDTIATTIRTSLNEALVQILSPKRRVDILRDCLEARKNCRPYVMTFCGVNACDTFRAGAVEQLRTHTRHLNALHPPEKHAGRIMVQLYEKGYGKDAAGIAMEAIRFAKDSGIDVVLVDTAGRMQDNEPLMRALAKLIKVNEPDLVLFVGEALVDGIVLTKFDTIDDKVGAAISMTYITGQPIVFIGTGQTYTDLKALNANAVVHALMK